MKNKILKLCKRMNKVSLEEMLPILCASEQEVQPILNELLDEKLITKNTNSVYLYNEPESIKPTLPIFFGFHTKDEVELIIKCFCSDIEVNKTINLIDSQKNTINKFYRYIRECIYATQLNVLLKKISDNPYIPQERTYFNKKYYLYIYDDKLYVSEKSIVNDYSKKYSNAERLKIKNLYLKSNRKVLNNSYSKLYHLHLAEEIFRCGKEYPEIYNTINNILYR